jgi:tetratricopeptide (TPR) repeat protein
MKTYRNDELGFEISIPENWSNPIHKDSYSVIFNCRPIEMFNIIVGFLIPERLSEFTEFEFEQHIKKHGYSELVFGRINVEEKNHVWARYNMGNNNWTKKYMIVFGGIEYAMTATCNDKSKFIEREIIWDAIVKSFRLHEWRAKRVEYIQENRSRVAGALYEKAYEASAAGHYTEACKLLEECIKENPDHVLAHKELAFVRKITGDIKGALIHRRKVKELDPSDKVNQFNLAGVLYLLGSSGEALHEVDELLSIEPNNKNFLALKQIITEKPISQS